MKSKMSSISRTKPSGGWSFENETVGRDERYDKVTFVAGRFGDLEILRDV